VVVVVVSPATQKVKAGKE